MRHAPVTSPQGKNPQHPLNMRLVVRQRRPGRFENEKNLFFCWDTNPGSPNPSPSHYTDYAIPVIVREMYKLCDFDISVTSSVLLLIFSFLPCYGRASVCFHPFPLCERTRSLLCPLATWHSLMHWSGGALLKTPREKQGQQHVTDIVFDPRLWREWGSGGGGGCDLCRADS